MNARAADTASVPISRVAADLFSLTKPRLSLLVLITAAGGMWLAPGEMGVMRALIALLATAGTVGAANALNCYYERDSDRFMKRTRTRPLPEGRMDPQVALGFGISLALVSIPLLTLAVNRLSGLLGLIALLSYVAAYTPMKAKSDWAMWVGALPGALPPLMGWTAVTGRLDAGGLALFAILCAWQLPHFLAIALFRKDEYAAAGLKSVPLVRGDDVARWQLLGLTLALVGTTLVPWMLGMAGLVYLLTAVLLGAVFLWLAADGAIRKRDAVWARKTFFFSLIHLTVIFAVLMADAVA